jgi:predicted secreted protein
MSKLSYPDQRSKKFIFIPFCLVCQAFQAKGIVRFGFAATIKPVIEEMLRHDVNIVQMPCPETQLFGLEREPKSFDDYNTEEFISLCDKLSGQVTEQIKAILSKNFQVVAILGMEYSPSCSVSLQYTNKGTIKRPGHFIASLEKRLKQEDIQIPFIGINRRGIKASVKRVKDILQNKLI